MGNSITGAIRETFGLAHQVGLAGIGIRNSSYMLQADMNPNSHKFSLKNRSVGEVRQRDVSIIPIL